jgi:hypothetical protein
MRLPNSQVCGIIEAVPSFPRKCGPTLTTQREWDADYLQLGVHDQVLSSERPL